MLMLTEIGLNPTRDKTCTCLWVFQQSSCVFSAMSMGMESAFNSRTMQWWRRLCSSKGILRHTKLNCSDVKAGCPVQRVPMSRC